MDLEVDIAAGSGAGNRKGDKARPGPEVGVGRTGGIGVLSFREVDEEEGG